MLLPLPPLYLFIFKISRYLSRSIFRGWWWQKWPEQAGLNYTLCLPLVKIEKGRGSQYLLLYLILLLSLNSFNQHSLNLYYMQLTMCLRDEVSLLLPHGCWPHSAVQILQGNKSVYQVLPSWTKVLQLLFICFYLKRKSVILHLCPFYNSRSNKMLRVFSQTISLLLLQFFLSENLNRNLFKELLFVFKI